MLHQPIIQGLVSSYSSDISSYVKVALQWEVHNPEKDSQSVIQLSSKMCSPALVFLTAGTSFLGKSFCSLEMGCLGASETLIFSISFLNALLQAVIKLWYNVSLQFFQAVLNTGAKLGHGICQTINDVFCFEGRTNYWFNNLCCL